MKSTMWLQAYIDQRIDKVLEKFGQEDKMQQLLARERTAYDALKRSMSEEERDLFIAWEEAYWDLHCIELERLYLLGLQDAIPAAASLPPSSCKCWGN